MIQEKFFTVKELAQMTNYHPNWFRLHKYEIGYYRMGRKILFPKENIDKYLEKRLVKASE